MYNNNNELLLRMEKINNSLKDYKSDIENNVKKIYQEQNDRIDEYLNKLETKAIIQERPGSYSNNHQEIESKNRSEYIRTGKINHNFDSKSQDYLSNLTDENLVKENFHKKIISSIEKDSVFRQISQVETVRGDNNEFIQSFDELDDIGWVEEIGTRLFSKAPTLTKLSIKLKEMYAQPKISANLLNDSAVNLDHFISTKVSDAFRKIENKAFLFGDGIKEPLGILNYNNSKPRSADFTAVNPLIEIITSEKNTITTEDILNLIFSLDSTYNPNACFVMHPNVLRTLRALKDPTSGQYLWQPSFNIGVPDRLMGFPVYLSRDMQSGENSEDMPIIFGDFKHGFLIIDCMVNSFVRDPYTEKPFIKFYITKRLGASVINPKALKILKMQ